MTEPQLTARTRKKRWTWLLCALLLLILFAAFAALRFTHHSNLQRELARIREAGFPASEHELDLWYTPVPDSSNAALIVLSASRSHRRPPPGLNLGQAITEANPVEPLSPETLAALASYLQQNSATLELLHQAALLPETRYPINLSRGASTLLPHLAGVGELSVLLKLTAIHHAAQNRPDDAARSLLNGLILAQTLRHEPILVSEAVRITSIITTLQALEHVLNRASLSQQKLLALQSQLANVETSSHRSFLRALVGERAIGFSIFDLSFQQIDSFSADSSLDLPLGTEIFGSTLFKTRQALGLRELDQQFYLLAMAELLNSATNQFPQMLPHTEATQRRVLTHIESAGRTAWITRLIFPSISLAARKQAELAARLRLAQAALALERYRIDHTTLPDHLLLLVPEYLPQLPPSPFNGSPLLYEVVADGFILSYEVPPGVHLISELNVRVSHK